LPASLTRDREPAGAPSANAALLP